MSRRSSVQAKPAQVETGLPATETAYLVPWPLLFAGSGRAALVYEIVWFQLLQLVIGSSAISLSTTSGSRPTRRREAHLLEGVRSQKSEVRMRTRSLLLGTLLLPWCGSAEVMCALGPGASSYKSAQDQRPTSDALQMAGRMNAALRTICADHCPVMALFRNSTASNAMLIADSGQAKLVYSPQFFAAAYENFGESGILAIMAHELGHALDDTMGAAWIKNTWSPELRADAWAGCILAKMDPGPKGLDPSLSALSKYPSPAHPGWNQRLPVLRTGYIQCGGNASKFGKRK